MYRVCVGKVSKATGRVGGGIPTTDEHGLARKQGIYILLRAEREKSQLSKLKTKRAVG